jgi:hypothetical protein
MEVDMLSEQAKVSHENQCQQAATTILDLLKYQCQGFILPPSEVKNLLGLPKEDRSWYLNDKVLKLRKDLAKQFVAIQVSPIQGITVMLYRVPQQAYVLCSAKSYRH